MANIYYMHIKSTAVIHAEKSIYIYMYKLNGFRIHKKFALF